VLTWLRDQVLALWSRVSSAFSYAASVASSYASSARNAAIAWARTAIDNIAAVLSSAIAAARSLAVNLYNSAVALARALEVGVRVALNLGLEAVRSFARGLHTAALAAIETAKVFLRVLVNLTADQLRAWVTALVGGPLAWFNAWKLGLEQILKWFQTEFPAGWQFLKGLMGLLNATNVQALADLLGRMYKWLVGFLADPLGYIAAFVMSFFIHAVRPDRAGWAPSDDLRRCTYHGAVGDYVPGGPGRAWHRLARSRSLAVGGSLRAPITVGSAQDGQVVCFFAASDRRRLERRRLGTWW
jgi:hypothetical protein